MYKVIYLHSNQVMTEHPIIHKARLDLFWSVSTHSPPREFTTMDKGQTFPGFVCSRTWHEWTHTAHTLLPPALMKAQHKDCEIYPGYICFSDSLLLLKSIYCITVSSVIYLQMGIWALSKPGLLGLKLHLAQIFL